MKKLKSTICLFLFLQLSALCSMAATTDTVRLYFGIDQFHLTDQHKTALKMLTDSADKTKVITVTGFCDYLGSKNYNQPLSERRANEVKNCIMTLDGQFQIIATGKGQILTTGSKDSIGEPGNRRVDIIFSKPKIVAKAEKAPAKTETISAKFEKKVDSLASLEVGKALPLEELTFEPGRHFVTYSSRPLLQILLKYLIEHKNLVFEIRGHVCCEPNGRDGIDFDENTWNLSVNRAREIYRYFKDNGIDPGRMTYTGVGASQPKVAEVTESDKQLNRRVEIVILKK